MTIAESTPDTASDVVVIDRVTTASGTVYEFRWDDPDDVEAWPRPGMVRKNGGPWIGIGLITRGFDLNTRMFWIREDDSTVHTSAIALVEAVLA